MEAWQKELAEAQDRAKTAPAAPGLPEGLAAVMASIGDTSATAAVRTKSDTIFKAFEELQQMLASLKGQAQSFDQQAAAMAVDESATAVPDLDFDPDLNQLDDAEVDQLQTEATAARG